MTGIRAIVRSSFTATSFTTYNTFSNNEPLEPSGLPLL